MRGIAADALSLLCVVLATAMLICVAGQSVAGLFVLALVWAADLFSARMASLWGSRFNLHPMADQYVALMLMIAYVLWLAGTSSVLAILLGMPFIVVCLYPADYDLGVLDKYGTLSGLIKLRHVWLITAGTVWLAWISLGWFWGLLMIILAAGLAYAKLVLLAAPRPTNTKEA